MSVYKRNRKETATQYVVTAQALQRAIVQYVMNEKYVPKKWRFVLAQTQETIKACCKRWFKDIGAYTILRKLGREYETAQCSPDRVENAPTFMEKINDERRNSRQDQSRP